MTLKAKKLGWDPVPMGQFVKALPGIDQSAFSGETPDRVTTDGHDAYPRAMREELGVTVKHRTNRYLLDRAGPRSTPTTGDMNFFVEQVEENF